MPPALIAGGIGAAASIGGAVLGANSTKKATQAAADTSLQTAQMNNALYRDIYNQNRAALAPFMQRGNAAGDQLNALLGLGGGMSNSAGYAQIAPANDYQQPNPNGYPTQAPAGWRPSYAGEQHFTQEPQYQASLGHMPYEDGNMPNAYGGAAAGYGMQPVNSPQATGATVPATAGTTQNNAFDTFRNSTGYQFRLGEGMNALNHGLASAGSINSGAAAKAAMRYGQNFASNEFGQYAGLLGQQQGVGLSGASALAGVGQNYAGMVGQSNQNAGDNAANALLMRGAANANMYQGIAGGLGNALGSSYMLWGR